MIETRFSSVGVSDPLGGLLDIRSAPVGYGYYEESATDAETRERCHHPRRGPVGWWQRHRTLRLGVGLALVANLGFLPAVQDAVLTGLSHVA
ncbi:hypothetical protein [Nocardia sp. CDC160]|uniref:hypothetical protein n=1 Tax=Nocardia sp. CDC160 TaxID=3112166 RepID=UPI002DBA58A8|nr:hypothetical protein [Nocardia sp. CDC160]MEC3919933.1 hypothetical protein [Nocardia sp. CDC160]